jgi:hypothetical protein
MLGLFWISGWAGMNVYRDIDIGMNIDIDTYTWEAKLPN